MQKQLNESKGFTLLEMVVVIIIIGILSAMAMTYYARFLERMRTAEVLQLMATTLSAQERNMLKRHHYVKQWPLLDSGPLKASYEGRTADCFSGDETHFYTNCVGDGLFSRPGFDMYFDQYGDKWFLVAERVGWGNLKYALVREFETFVTYCVPKEGVNDTDTLQMCADFMGVEKFEDIPPDPRTNYQTSTEENP